MAKPTAAQKKALEEAQANAARLTLTPEDAHNILVLLNRVTTTGTQEAMLLAVLAQKLAALKGAYQGTANGEDAPPVD
jgi:hypothetical protein